MSSTHIKNAKVVNIINDPKKKSKKKKTKKGDGVRSAQRTAQGPPIWINPKDVFRGPTVVSSNNNNNAGGNGGGGNGGGKSNAEFMKIGMDISNTFGDLREKYNQQQDLLTRLFEERLTVSSKAPSAAKLFNNVGVGPEEQAAQSEAVSQIFNPFKDTIMKSESAPEPVVAESTATMKSESMQQPAASMRSESSAPEIVPNPPIPQVTVPDSERRTKKDPSVKPDIKPDIKPDVKPKIEPQDSSSGIYDGPKLDKSLDDIIESEMTSTTMTNKRSLPEESESDSFGFPMFPSRPEDSGESGGGGQGIYIPTKSENTTSSMFKYKNPFQDLSKEIFSPEEQEEDSFLPEQLTITKRLNQRGRKSKFDMTSSILDFKPSLDESELKQMPFSELEKLYKSTVPFRTASRPKKQQVVEVDESVLDYIPNEISVLPPDNPNPFASLQEELFQ